MADKRRFKIIWFNQKEEKYNEMCSAESIDDVWKTAYLKHRDDMDVTMITITTVDPPYEMRSERVR